MIRPRTTNRLRAQAKTFTRGCTFTRGYSFKSCDQKDPKDWTVLGIETSCDDTAVALLRGKKILAERVSSQWETVTKWGGVHPVMAARDHDRNIGAVLHDVLDNSGISTSEIDAVAVTVGPGLSPCLKVGLETAKKLALETGVPLIGVNHLVGHTLMGRFFAQSRQGIQGYEDAGSTCAFPFLTLIASGGHTATVIAHGVDDYQLVGTTTDDSVGEVFDKVARLLNLSIERNGDVICGGAALEEWAKIGNESYVKFPIPKVRVKDCNFSFSGLKSAVSRKVENSKDFEEQDWFKQDIAASFQITAFNHLVQRTRLAMMVSNCTPQVSNEVDSKLRDKVRKEFENHEDYIDAVTKETLSHREKPTCLVVSGGVASNKTLRYKMDGLGVLFGLPVLYPEPKHCTDNAVMIAWAAIEFMKHQAESHMSNSDESYFVLAKTPSEIKEINVQPRWRFRRK